MAYYSIDVRFYHPACRRQFVVQEDSQLDGDGRRDRTWGVLGRDDDRARRRRLEKLEYVCLGNVDERSERLDSTRRGFRYWLATDCVSNNVLRRSPSHE